MANLGSDHWRITAAGWRYRNNERGWIIYMDPRTGRWHTRAEALAIVAADASASQSGRGLSFK